MKLTLKEKAKNRLERFTENAEDQAKIMEELTQLYIRLEEIDSLPYFQLFGTRAQQVTAIVKTETYIKGLEGRLFDLKLEAVSI